MAPWVQGRVPTDVCLHKSGVVGGVPSVVVGACRWVLRVFVFVHGDIEGWGDHVQTLPCSRFDSDHWNVSGETRVRCDRGCWGHPGIVV